jgi:hypothetical protein
MSKKNEKLTAEQKALLPVYRDKWLEIGLSTEPLDFEKAKIAVCAAYESAGLSKPTKFYTAKSPFDAIGVIQELNPKMKAKDIFNDMSYGCHNANWLGFYQYFRDVVNLKVCEKLNGLIDLASHCGWLNMYEDTVVFQDRPEHIKFDDQNRLHCENGPAILYRDGYGVYAWHGVRIPSEWITNKGELTAKTALTWVNTEQRKAACEIVGWAKVLRELNARVIESDEDPMIGTLLEVDIPDIGKEKFLKVLCGTGREFAIPVPPNMKTALEANAWTYGLDGDVLRQLEVRT